MKRVFQTAADLLSARQHVPSIEGIVSIEKSRLQWRDRRLPFRLGHVDRHQLFNRWIQVRGVILELVHADRRHVKSGEHWKRVEMVMEALRLQATRGVCYASADYLAASSGSSRKTWYRCLEWLRSRDMAATARLVRRGGFLSTNVVDLAGLWTVVTRLLGAKRLQFERVGRQLWAKQRGFWTLVEVKSRRQGHERALAPI